MSPFMCHMSSVICHLSPVTCHLSSVNNANSHSHRPSPCSPTMQSRLICKNQKTKKKFNLQKNIKPPSQRGMAILAIHSFHQKSPVYWEAGFCHNSCLVTVCVFSLFVFCHHLCFVTKRLITPRCYGTCLSENQVMEIILTPIFLRPTYPMPNTPNFPVRGGNLKTYTLHNSPEIL